MDAALSRLVTASDTASPYQRRGMAAYRSHAALQGARTLAVAFPVIENILGNENFQGLARSLWRAHPPQHGDLGQWGEEMAAHIESLNDLVLAEPYLADLARLEWALHRAERAADDAAEPASMALLLSEDPDSLGLRLAPGAGSCPSPWPVASLIEAYRRQLPVPGTLLDKGEAETAIYWRKGWRGSVRQAKTGEERFLAALLRGETLAVALASAEDFDFGGWLTPAFQEGLLLRVFQVSAPAKGVKPDQANGHSEE